MKKKSRNDFGKHCAIIGILLNVTLFIIKYFAGLITLSVAIKADAFNNLMDAASSVISLLGFSVAGKKTDKEHPFGHGRAEYLAGLIIAALITVTGAELLFTSVKKIFQPQQIETGLIPAIILIVAIAVKMFMFIYNRHIGNKIESETLRAVAADSFSDMIITFLVLTSMAVQHFFDFYCDPWVGSAVAVFVIYSGIKETVNTISPLLGTAPGVDYVHSIEDTVMAHKEAIGLHDMIVHDYGPGRKFITLHVEVNGSGNLFELHDAIDNIEKELSEKFNCLATIHMDPVDTTNTELPVLKNKVMSLAKTICPDFSVHDFRTVPGPSHTNLIFDLLIPADYRFEDSEVCKQLSNLISENIPGCFAVIHIDRGYC